MGIRKLNDGGGSSTHSLPRVETPLLSGGGKPVVLSSQPKTFANVFIAIVGAGVLGLPYTFMRTGWLTSLVTVFAVSILTYHGMMLLVRTRRRIEESTVCSSSAKITSFGDLGFAVCGCVGRSAVDLMIVLSQAGFCVGYLIFIGNTLANLFTSSLALAAAAPTIWGFSAKTLYIWGCFPFELALNSIPSLTLLAPLSIFADIVDLAAMGLVMIEDALLFSRHMPPVEAFGTFSTFFYGLGVAVYSFEGVGMALPLESEMKDKSKFGRILCLTMIIIAAIYGAFGVMGYFAFGNDTQDIITANMGKGLLSTFVQLGLCINLFFTFPLMMNPVYEVFERRLWEGRYCIWLRWMLVLAVCLVALFVPNFADFLSLVGSSTCCVLGFVLPALFHYLTFKDEMSRRQAGLDLAVIVLGTSLGVVGTWYSLQEIFSVKV
ncbi:amino acid transporter AVT3B-like [Salvia miltiorrhiza]|uniref:amino acid transporter AVT3B-like n=1 Tax=Salvia miltiorrhiza TaxID=226208 RepID=UPI0025AD14FA|nr:amino acid transporter AVT3B-like [Salvia miltiorrhiza]